jgi:hypothetical protein
VELDEHEHEHEQHQPHKQHQQHEHAQVRASEEHAALHQLCQQEKEKAEAARMRAEAENKRATQLQEQLGHALAEVAIVRQVPSLDLPLASGGFKARLPTGATRCGRVGVISTVLILISLRSVLTQCWSRFAEKRSGVGRAQGDAYGEGTNAAGC